MCAPDPQKGVCRNLSIYFLSVYVQISRTAMTKAGSYPRQLPPGTLANDLAYDEVRVETNAGTDARRKRTANAYIPAIPLRIVKAAVQTDAVLALPLVLAIHRQLTMTGRSSTPLNATVWASAGSPSRRKREVILRRLRTIPDVIRVEEDRTSQTRYRASRGELWDDFERVRSTDNGN